jgi:hypothetical protein
MGISTFSQQTVNTGLANPAGSGNVIINGAFDIWQRGTSGTSLGSNVFLADRWTHLAASPVNINQTTDTPFNAGFSFTIRRTGGSNTQLHQRIEADDCILLAGQTVTLSFYLKENTGGVQVSAAFSSANAKNNFSTVTSITDQVIGTSTTTWQRYSITTTLTNNVKNGLEIRLLLNAINRDVSFWGVQLELGAVATPFRRNAPSIQAELAACQRYFVRLIDPSGSGVGTGGTSGGASRVSISLPVEMRVLPSVSASGTFTFWNGSLVRTGPIVSNPGRSRTNIEVESTLDAAFPVGDAVKMYMENNASKIIDVSAEL